MKELSLNILDIVKNSVKAGATKIEITVAISTSDDRLEIVIADNGCGMSKEFLARVRDPFTTTRTTRKAGLGIPFFEAAALQSGGDFDIESEEGVGTVGGAGFGYTNIDRAPLGNMSETMEVLISGSPEIRFLYNYIIDGKEFNFDTDEIKKQLGDIPLSTPEVLSWIGEYIEEGTK